MSKEPVSTAATKGEIKGDNSQEKSTRESNIIAAKGLSIYLLYFSLSISSLEYKFYHYLL